MPNSRANTGDGAPCKGPCKAGPLHAWHSKGEVCSAKHLPAIPRATLPMRVQSLRSFSLAMQTMHPRSLPSQSSPQCRSCQAHNAGLGLARPALVLAWCCLGRQTMRVTLLALVFHWVKLLNSEIKFKFRSILVFSSFSPEFSCFWVPITYSVFYRDLHVFYPTWKHKRPALFRSCPDITI
jgi:hypothetical protein